MRSSLVIFGDDGTARMAASAIAPVLGPSRAVPAAHFSPSDADLDVIIASLRDSDLPQGVKDLAMKNREWLRGRMTALVCTSADSSDGVRAIGWMREIVGEGVIDGGVLVAPVSAADGVRCALDLKKLRDSSGNRMPREELMAEAVDFLKSHNTCALATAGDMPRATPLEYSYADGCIFILSEGGEKFAGLLANGRASIAVYDSYRGIESLAGIQITGRAEVFSPGSSEQRDILRMKGLDPSRIAALPFDLYAIRVKMARIEFLKGDLKRRGYDVRQVVEIEACGPSFQP